MQHVSLWDRFLWRLGPVQRLAFVPRDLRGTWRGTLSSQWDDPTTSTRIPTKTAYLVIRQTFLEVSVILLTDESRSVSSLGVVNVGQGIAALNYMYLNRPDSSVEHRSRMHH